MEVTEIVQLDKLLSGKLPPTKKFQKQEVTRLSAAGENYGSLMLAVKIVLKNEENNQNEDLHVVAKLPPPNEFLQQVFNTVVTFKNEIGFYDTIVPMLQNYQKQHGIENVLQCFAKFYGSRLSLNPASDKVDNDAVLLLENLKISKFDCASRIVGFNLDEAQLILKNLAEFQAVPLAIWKNNPELFETELKPLFPYFKMLGDDTAMKKQMQEQLIELLEENEEIRKHLPRMKEIFGPISDRFLTKFKNASKYTQGPYVSICHTDLWVNNIMLKLDDDGKPKECMFVDFQIYELGPLVIDLLFFLLTSVKIPVVEQHFDALIKHYHDHLVHNLKQLQCDISEYSLDKFHSELKKFLLEYEFFHIFFMLNPILAPKGTVKDLDELSQEEMSSKKEICKEHKERLAFIINFMDKRGWIY